MDVNMQAVLLFHNHQATTPNVPFIGNISSTTAATMAVPAKEQPPAEPEPAPQEEEKTNG